ncbi:MAG: hypothetical protein CMJ24_12235 [Phycisphaerae bacterium]|jgi:hypothetical protein|nr:hypothetical protein [Phycisphaerae bacterium]MDG1898790.1 hypothetical protein [Phycisphaerales bacterium]|tara:strand:- start:12678 stop:13088 length:411 start_codon:yes stop_codon:yes gene_type:complete
MRTLLLIVFAASLTACHSQLKPPSERLAGTWSSTFDGTVMQLIADDGTSGSYVVRDADEPMRLSSGTFKATETEISFVDDAGACEGIEGRYDYAIMTTAIQFDAHGDDCPEREKRTASESWVRVFMTNPEADSDER